MKNKTITQYNNLNENLFIEKKSLLSNDEIKFYYIKNYYNYFSIFSTPKTLVTLNLLVDLSFLLH